MILKVRRNSIEISPENEEDEGYIEEILGLKQNGDFIKLKRINAMGLSALAYLEAEKEKNDG